MYLTAHRLVSPLGDEGTNAFLHLHGAAFEWPEDPGSLIQDPPGDPVERRTELPPGGNRVRAFLDVVAPDGAGRAELHAAVAALAASLEGKANPTWHEEGRVVLKFGVDGETARAGSEARLAALRALHAAVDLLLERRAS